MGTMDKDMLRMDRAREMSLKIEGVKADFKRVQAFRDFLTQLDVDMTSEGYSAEDKALVAAKRAKLKTDLQSLADSI